MTNRRGQSLPAPLIHVSYQHLLREHDVRQLNVFELAAVDGCDNERFEQLFTIVKLFVEQRIDNPLHFSTDQMIVFTGTSTWDDDWNCLQAVLRRRVPWAADANKERHKTMWPALRCTSLRSSDRDRSAKLTEFKHHEFDIVLCMGMISRSASVPGVGFVVHLNAHDLNAFSTHMQRIGRALRLFILAAIAGWPPEIAAIARAELAAFPPNGHQQATVIVLAQNNAKPTTTNFCTKSEFATMQCRACRSRASLSVCSATIVAPPYRPSVRAFFRNQSRQSRPLLR